MYYLKLMLVCLNHSLWLSKKSVRWAWILIWNRTKFVSGSLKTGKIMDNIIKFRNFFKSVMLFTILLSMVLFVFLLGYTSFFNRSILEILMALLFFILIYLFYLTPYCIFVCFLKIKAKYEKLILFSIPFYLIVCNYIFDNSDYLLQEGIERDIFQFFRLFLIYSVCAFASNWILKNFERKHHGKSN